MTDATLLLQLRAQYKRLEQLTWTVRELQNRYPLGTPESEQQLLKSYIDLRLDLQEISKEINKLRKRHKNSEK